MNVFEFVIIIIIVSSLYKLVAIWMRNRARSDGEQPVRSDLQKRLEEVEERVRVLERIVTDERFDLEQQFKDLGK